MWPALAPASDAPVIEGTPFNWISNDRIVSVAFAIARERRDVFRPMFIKRNARPILFYTEKSAQRGINGFGTV